MEQKPHYSSTWISIKEIITVSTSFYILQFLVEHFNWVLHFSLFINNKQNAPLVISYLVFLKLKTESSPCHCVFQVEQRQSNTGTRFSFFFIYPPVLNDISNVYESVRIKYLSQQIQFNQSRPVVYGLSTFTKLRSNNSPPVIWYSWYFYTSSEKHF